MVVMAIVLFGLLLAGGSRIEERKEPKQPDTIYVKKPYKVDTVRIKTPPEIVKIYKLDTILREKVIRDTIILEIEKKFGRLTVDRIATNGLIQQEIHTLGFMNNFVIDHKGNVKIKKNKLLKVAIFSAITASIAYYIHLKIKN